MSKFKLGSVEKNLSTIDPPAQIKPIPGLAPQRDQIALIVSTVRLFLMLLSSPPSLTMIQYVFCN